MVAEPEIKISTGIAGLDKILLGGLTQGRAYTVTGIPGTGKTILGYHFLSAATADEKCLFISLQQTEKDIRNDAQKLGIDLSRVKIMDLSSSMGSNSTEELFATEPTQDTIASYMLKTIKEFKPSRIFIDPLTHYRFLSHSVFSFRRQVMNMLRFLNNEGITVLFSSDLAAGSLDEDLQILADGIITLQRTEGRRKLLIQKMRGSDFIVGFHSFIIDSKGIQVYYRLVPSDHSIKFSHGLVGSGIKEIDELLGGGIERGTITMISGPTGVGKTSLALQFLKDAADRNERSAMYLFEEEEDIATRQAQSINVPINSMIECGLLSIKTVEPLRYSSDEFALMVRKEVEEQGTKIVMIDSVSGYKLSINGDDLIKNLHALGKYLQRMGVTVFIVIETSNILNSDQISEIGISYLADNIIFLRYFEADGGLRKAIGVLKKRMGDFENKLRNFEITKYGLKVGEPLINFRGIFSGIPLVIKDE